MTLPMLTKLPIPLPSSVQKRRLDPSMTHLTERNWADRRLRRQRCDAGRPCAACYNSQRVCIYDGDPPANSASEETDSPGSTSSELVAFKDTRLCTGPLSSQLLILQSPPGSFVCSGVPLTPHPTLSFLMPKVPPECLKVSDISTGDLHLNLCESYYFELEL